MRTGLVGVMGLCKLVTVLELELSSVADGITAGDMVGVAAAVTNLLNTGGSGRWGLSTRPNCLCRCCATIMLWFV